MTSTVDAPPVPDPGPTPPDRSVGPVDWVRANLFSGPFNSLVTVVFGAVVVLVVYRAVRFVLVTAEWEIVERNLTLFMVGRFDREQLWRLWAAGGILVAVVGVASGAAAVAAAAIADQQGRVLDRITWRSRLRRFWPLALLVIAILSFTTTPAPTVLVLVVLAVGVVARSVGSRLPAAVRRFTWLIVLVGLVAAVQVLSALGGVGWDGWGGLHLSLFVAAAGILLAFPLGLLLALGRRSSLPAVRIVSIGYIEFFRGVPLITLLLMGQFIIGFFLPPDATVPSVLIRALAAIVIFEAAYIAEIVRGGLQSIDRGQVEAAQALGLRPWTTTRRIVLPQALRAVIPSMVGQFISLFQDTSLLSILAFLELLQVAQVVTNQEEFVGRGLQSVTLPFVAFIYWAVSYSMSRESRALETRLGVGTR